VTDVRDQVRDRVTKDLVTRRADRACRCVTNSSLVTTGAPGILQAVTISSPVAEHQVCRREKIAI
jgi:hypothetical protein